MDIKTRKALKFALLLLIIVTCMNVWKYIRPNKRAVSWPEEITVARKGDKLIVDSVDQDSVYIVFDNPQNK